MRKLILAIGVICTLSAGSALADVNKNLSPEEMGQYMEVMMVKMMEVYSSPKMADAQAKYYKNLYDALQKQGFTKEEAIQIVVSQGSLLGSSSE